MLPLPPTEQSLLLRTDFSDDRAWESVRAAVQRPSGLFHANLHILSDPAYRDLTLDQIQSLAPPGSPHTFLFVVDRETLGRPDHPVLVVDLFDQRGRTFRVAPAAIGSVENNLSIANMDFEEFADAVDEDGVFRGFPRG